MPIGPDDFCVLADLKAWLNMQTSAEDTLLQNLITRGSLQMLRWMNRDHIIATTYTENRDGNDVGRALLWQSMQPILRCCLCIFVKPAKASMSTSLLCVLEPSSIFAAGSLELEPEPKIAIGRHTPLNCSSNTAEGGCATSTLLSLYAHARRPLVTRGNFYEPSQTVSESPVLALSRNSDRGSRLARARPR